MPGAFFGAAALSLVAFGTQLKTLPPMAVTTRTSLAGLWHVLQVPKVALGMLGVLLVFGGRQTLATYLRPFLEQITGLGYSGVSLALFMLGIGVFIGNTFFAARLLKRNLHLTISGLTLLNSLIGLTLIFAGQYAIATFALILVWGMATGISTVGWSTWLTRVVPHKAESGGGVLVAAIQVAIMIGAAAGGLAIDSFGTIAPAALSSAILFTAAILCWFVLADHSEPLT